MLKFFRNEVIERLPDHRWNENMKCIQLEIFLHSNRFFRLRNRLIQKNLNKARGPHLINGVKTLAADS